MPAELKTSEPKDPGFSHVSGVILAGGKSGRYGRNKALVKIGPLSLIERVIRVMRSVSQEVVLITNAPDEYAHLGLPMHKDLIPGLGPLGGIYTGLNIIPHKAGFFVACDMPALNASLIRHMVEISPDFDVVAARIDGKIESLHALYTKGCLQAIKGLIDTQQYQVFRFFHLVSVRYIDEMEIRSFDPEFTSFINVNRPEELRRFTHP